MARASSFGKLARDVLGQVLRSRTGGRGRGAGEGDGRGARGGRGGVGGIRMPHLGPAVGRDARRGEVETAVGRLQVAYEPVRDDDADPGEIVWAWVPYEEDPTKGKDRPLLVIGRVGEDVAALAMTSRPHDDPHHHPIGSGPWDRGGRPSWIKLDRLVRLDPDGIRREGAVIDRPRFDDVIAAWQAY